MRSPLLLMLLGAALLIVFLASVGMLFVPRDNFADIGSVSSVASANAPLTKSEGSWGQLSPPPVAPLVSPVTPSLHAPSSALIQQLLATPAVEIPASSVPTANSAASQASAKSPVTVNPLLRDTDAVSAQPPTFPSAPPTAGLPPMALPGSSKCPDCPVCPDMSQYIKMDEVPCWNCSLP